MPTATRRVETIPHPAGAQLRLDGPPLDFLMVSDHAKFLGVFAAQLDTEAPFYGHPDARDLVPDPDNQEWKSIGQIIRDARKLVRGGTPEFMGERVWKYTWERIIEAAGPTMIRAQSLLLLDTSTPSPLDQDICTEMLFLQEAMYRIVHLVRTIQIIQKISGIGWRPSGQMASSL